jgi:hypothetical protein
MFGEILSMVVLNALIGNLARVFPNVSFPFEESTVIATPDLFGGIILLAAGLLIIAVIIAAAIALLPAIIAAGIVWFLTGSLFLAGIAFLLVAVVWLAAMADDD